jgi:aryl-alcohol dehydrogenase-like predicted oxidoreductase
VRTPFFAEEDSRQNRLAGFASRIRRHMDCPAYPEEAAKVVRTAFDLGITYFDTAKLDGDSEEKLGAALKGVRDQCVIATKTGSRTKRESLQDLKESLRRLHTDRLDIIQLHGIDDERTLRKAMAKRGCCRRVNWRVTKA